MRGDIGYLSWRVSTDLCRTNQHVEGSFFAIGLQYSRPQKRTGYKCIKRKATVQCSFGLYLWWGWTDVAKFWRNSMNSDQESLAFDHVCFRKCVSIEMKARRMQMATHISAHSHTNIHGPASLNNGMCWTWYVMLTLDKCWTLGFWIEEFQLVSMYHFLEPPDVSARDLKSSIYMTQLCPMRKKCFVLKNVGTTKQAMFLCLDLSESGPSCHMRTQPGEF